jgi:hypothetical protein
MTDWYIDQMKMKTYEADGVPISFTHDQYVGDKLDYAVYNGKTEARWNIKDLIDFIRSDDPRTTCRNAKRPENPFLPDQQSQDSDR